MRTARTMVVLLAAAGAVVSSAASAAAGTRASGTKAGHAVLPPPPGYSEQALVFSDAFSSAALDRSSWNTYIASRASDGWPWNSNDKGGSGVENPSNIVTLEYDEPSQVRIRPSGLTITAEERPTEGVLGGAPELYSWRSGVVTTYGHFEFTGGFVEIRAKMPTGAGIWPALWMLPGPDAPHSVNDEIDIFEGNSLDGRAKPADTFSWHLHTATQVLGGTTDVGTNLGSGYHLYGLEWIPGQLLRWYLDGRLVGQLTSAQISIPTEPMELIANVEVANAADAQWHTVPTPATPKRDSMVIDAVSVYALGS